MGNKKKKQPKSEEYEKRKKAFEDRKEKRIEKDKNEKNERLLKDILNFVVTMLTVFVCITFAFCVKWRLGEFYREPKWIVMCYLLYMFLQIVIVHLYLVYPSYNGYSPGKMRIPDRNLKLYYDNILIVLLTIGIGIITRLIADVFLIKLLVISINVCFLEFVLYKFEEKHPLKVEAKYKARIIPNTFYRIANICCKIFLVFFFIEIIFTSQYVANFEMFIRNG